jgi:hypothetical protein
MKAEILHEIKNVCEVLTLAGLRENPYPMVNRTKSDDGGMPPGTKSLASSASTTASTPQARLHGSNCSPCTDP